MDRIGNHQRVYSRDAAPYKASVVLLAGQAAIAAGLEDVARLRDGYTRSSGQFTDFQRRWNELPSQHSGLSWGRLLLAAGIETVPSDPWLTDFASAATGESVTGEGAIALLDAAARAMNVTGLRLRNAIWLHQNSPGHHWSSSPQNSGNTSAAAAA
jgi:hypothetical protein